MLAYLPLIQKLILDYMTRKTTGHSFIFNLQGMAFLLFSGILGFVVLIFLLLAFQTYTAELYGVPQSWLLTAAVTFLLAVFFYLMGSFSRKRKGLISKIKEEAEEHLSPISNFVEELAAPVKEHPLAAVLLAGLAGLLAGDKLGNNGTDS